jgi:transposase
LARIAIFGPNARMSMIPPELEAQMTPAVKAFVLALFDRIEKLEEQVQNLTPRNYSVPPSTEHPHAKPKRNQPPGTKRKKGGQKGHKRHLRELVPTEECTTVTKHFPEARRRCGGGL